MSSIFFRTVSLIMAVLATLVTRWSVRNIDGLLDHRHMLAALAAFSVLYLALNWEPALPPLSSVARVAIALISGVAVVLWFNGAAAWFMILAVIWAAVLVVNYDLVSLWWNRLRRNRRVRKQRRRLARQTQEDDRHQSEGLSIFEPEPVA